MADSVGVFIPILKSSADNIKKSLDESRRKVLHQHDSLDENISRRSFIGMDSVVEEEQEGNSVNFVQEDKSDVLDLSPPHKIVSLPPILAPKIQDIPLRITQHKPPVPVQATEKTHTLVQSPPTTLQSGKSNQKIPVVSKNTWLSTIKDSATSNIASITQVLVFVFTVYVTIVYFKSGKALEDATGYLHSNVTDRPVQERQFGTRLSKSLSRSVYLRDLDEGVLKNSILPPYSQSER